MKKIILALTLITLAAGCSTPSKRPDRPHGPIRPPDPPIEEPTETNAPPEEPEFDFKPQFLTLFDENLETYSKVHTHAKHAEVSRLAVAAGLLVSKSDREFFLVWEAQCRAIEVGYKKEMKDAHGNLSVDQIDNLFQSIYASIIELDDWCQSLGLDRGDLLADGVGVSAGAMLYHDAFLKADASFGSFSTQAVDERPLWKKILLFWKK